MDLKITNNINHLQTGIWRGELALPDNPLPFNFEIEKGENHAIKMIFHNVEERITATEIAMQNDSLVVKMPIFDSEFHLQMQEDGKKLAGFWWNKARKDKNKITFTAEAGKNYRFQEEAQPASKNYDFSGTWQARFGIDEKEAAPYNAVAEFSQKDNILTGTFLTETGDYRYLQGVVIGDEFKLSCFDGSHAFLFTGTIDPKKNIFPAYFYSGIHHKETWEAAKNQEAIQSLAKADTLTYLKKGYEKLTFSFPNLENQQISLQDKRYQNKVVILQIMGSWCPNCMDETKFLTELYKKYHNKGLEIIGLSYEKTNEFGKAVENVKRLKSHFGSEYEFLIAGSSDKIEAAQTLPALNAIIAYPTTIFINKQGKVSYIHTGFSGPTTGEHYKKLSQEIEERVQQLLK